MQREYIMKFCMIWIVLSTSSFLAAGAKKEVDLILVGGQSNAVGFDTIPGKLPPSSVDKKVLFWWRCGDSPVDESKTNPPSLIVMLSFIVIV